MDRIHNRTSKEYASDPRSFRPGEAILSSLREFRIAVTILSLSSVLLEGILSSPKFRGNPT